MKTQYFNNIIRFLGRLGYGPAVIRPNYAPLAMPVKVAGRDTSFPAIYVLGADFLIAPYKGWMCLVVLDRPNFRGFAIPLVDLGFNGKITY